MYKSSQRRFGFTLAEVLITLGVIGVVAALTLPAIVQNYQKMVLKNQFKKSYSLFWTALRNAQANMGGYVDCFYWINSSDRPLSSDGDFCTAVCSSYNSYGTCTAWKCSNGAPLPSTYNGLITDCKAFNEELFNNVLKVVKFCPKEALKNGCITEKFQGADQVAANNNPDKDPDPNSSFSLINVRNKFPAAVLADGTIIIKWSTMGGLPYYAIDINGNKGPNRWGYDIFSLQISGSPRDGIIRTDARGSIVDKGGMSSQQMILDMIK